MQSIRVPRFGWRRLIALPGARRSAGTRGANAKAPERASRGFLESAVQGPSPAEAGLSRT